MKKMTRQFLLFSFFILLSFMAASCEGVSIGERIIYDDGLSSDADLTGLTVSQGTFNYPFNRYDWAYSVSVEYTVDSIKLTPTAVHKRSEISIITGEDPEGFTVESGSESKAISLDVGFNTIRIKITAQDDTARCYIVFVIRHTEAYINTELASLSISGIDLDQPFDPETTEYSATTSGSSISISAEAAGSSDGGSISYTMNGLPILDPGSIVLPAEDNVITITVTAGNGSTREYTITITVAARLAALSIEGEVLSPVFDPDSAVRVYSAELTAASINVTAEAASASDGAAVAFSMNGIPIPDPSAIDLAKGALNQLDILVTAPNGAVSESYTLNVTRLDDNPANANLAGLSLSGSGGEAVALSPAFDAGTTGYTVTMSSALNPVSLTTSAAGAGATISILLDSSPVPDAAAMTLNSGDNTLIARVTAANGSTTRDYTITVTMNMDAGLSALAFTASDLSPIALSPSFEQGVSDYTATVKAALSPISIAATAATGGATVEILLDGTPVGDPSSVSLTNETSVITARVSAGAVTKDYTITVTLRSGSDNAYLSNIVLTMGSGNTQRPLYSDFNSPGSTGFSRDTLEYAAVIYSFDTITVNATAEDSNVSAITVNGSGTVSGGSVSQATPLSAGKGYVTDIAIVVTAEDGSTQQTYTIHAKLLSIHEYYWGVYGPPMTKSYDKWQPKPTFSDKTVNGEVSGNLYWEIKSVSGGIRNYMNLTDYNDGKYDIDYNDNGFVANGELQAVLVSMGGTQTGTYTLTSPWGDSLASMDYHLTIKSADKVVGPDSYTTCNYMGESEVMFYTGDTAPYPFESGYNWYESWPDPQP